MVGLLDVIDKESCASFFMDNVTRTIVIVYTIQHERCFDSLERLWLGILSSRAREHKGHVQNHCLHLQLKVLWKPTNYHVQIKFCYKNLIWVWAIYARLAKVLGSSTTLLNVLMLLFDYLLPCKIGTNVCQNFGKQKIVSTSGIPRFFFSKRLIAISTQDFSRSCFSNPLVNNFKLNGLSKCLWWKTFHIC